MKFFDLFSGIGGFHLGMQRAGHECVGACDIDKYKRKVYSQHFPETPMYKDARAVNPKELPDFEILCAGFPCQAFSIAGKRRGFEDTRGTVFFEIARIAKEKRPRILLLENVKGLLSHRKGETYRTIRDTLDEMGYTVQWQLLNSKYFVPQNRERIFIIYTLRERCSREIFPVGNGGNFNDRAQQKTQRKRQRIRSKYTGSIDANYHKGGGSRTMICRPVLTPDRLKKRQNGRRIKLDGEPSFTLTVQDKHGIFNGKRIRRLTPVECERLQSFPDNWTESVSDTQRYRGIGDAVTVDVIEYVARLMTGRTSRFRRCEVET